MRWQTAAQPVRHVFTHFELVLVVRVAHLPPGRSSPNGLWLTRDDMADAALPSVMRKVAAHALALTADTSSTRP
ncbi:MAG: NUDIX domain-containing protein [Proteobacteria bacterium]|nr:NUDIX domain-containing protein [Pseudomonadota bacterium]